MSTTTKNNMTRRQVLGGLGLTLAAVPLSQLLACGDKDPEAGRPGGPPR